MKLIYFIRHFRSFLKTNYSGKEFKTLRSNIWSTFWKLMLHGPAAWIQGIFCWPIAMLFRKRIEKKAINSLINNSGLLSAPKQIVNAAFELRTFYAELLRERQDCYWYIEWKFPNKFSPQEKEVIIDYIMAYDFDRMMSVIKTGLGRFYYYLFFHLDKECFGEPIVPKWFKPHLEKWYWLRIWLFFPIRNPLDMKFYIDTKFLRTTNLFEKEIIVGTYNTTGRVEIDGIGIQELGEQFYYTSDFKYFTYRYTTPHDKVKKDGQWGRMFGFGHGVQPDLYQSRGALGIASRGIYHEPMYYDRTSNI